MKCPFCGKKTDKVVDSRVSTKEQDSIRRRRECLHCHRRFTTYERVEESFPFVTKKDGRREQYNREKIMRGIQRALEKRPIGKEAIDMIVNRIEKWIVESSDKDISSIDIGAKVMQELKLTDDVAYVRFASVYKQFKDVSEFMDSLNEILSVRKKTKDR